MVEAMFSTLYYIRTSGCQRSLSLAIWTEDHLPIMFSILDSIRGKEALDPVDKLTDWELFQSLASKFISPNNEIHFSNEADKAARDFEAFIASAYRLSTRKKYNFGPEI
jgi:hypothetical protein